MRRNRKAFEHIVMVLTLLMFCWTSMLSSSIQPVQAEDSSLPDKAIDFIKTDYQNNGAENDLSIHYPYVAYVLDLAGADWEEWEHNGIALEDAVNGIVDADISNSSAPVKYIAQDLILMQAIGDATRVSQLESILRTRQCQDGSFQDDTNAFSIIPAYELLGRADKLSIVDTVYAQTYILDQQADNGAWTRDWADFMETSQAVRALNYLAPAAAPDSTVGQAVAEGCSWMQDQQQSGGSFKTTFDDALVDTAEAIATQKALGLDPASAWTSGGNSAVDYLTSSSLNSDGSFGESKNVTDAAWALDSFTLLGINPSGGGGGGSPTEVSVRVQVEGAAGNLADATVDVSGTALDALSTAVGSDQVAAPGGFVTSIKGESGQPGAAPDTDTAWFFYAIRDGSIDPASLSCGAGSYNVEEGDHIVFYIGAYGHTTYAPKTYFPIVSISPQSASAGQTLTINISAQKYDWSSGLQDLDSVEAAEIGDYAVEANGSTYTSQYGQVTIPDAAEGSLSLSITNYNTAGYPNIVAHRDAIDVAAAVAASVRVQVEGAASNLADATLDVSGTALDALSTAVGSDQVVAPGGFVTSIKGESGQTGAAPDTDTAWFFYAIRDGSIDPASLSCGAGSYNVEEGDHIVFYIGAYGHTTYAPKTYFPIVSISPQSASAGQTLTINISAQKYDWSSGLQDLDSVEAAEIGDYALEANGNTYTSQYGQVTIPNLTEGTLDYSITNYNLEGYPDVVPSRGSISVAAKSGGGSITDEFWVGVAVVDKTGELLFGPDYVTIPSTSEWGTTVLGTLDATGLSYTTSSKHSGFVNSIAGQPNSGQQGWMFTLNDTLIMNSASDVPVSSGDRVIWYYSQDIDQAAPTWSGLSSGLIIAPTQVNDTTGKADVDPAAGGTVGQGTDARVIIPEGALSGSSPVQVAVVMLATPPPAPSGFLFLGQAYEFTIDGNQIYSFNKPVTLSFTFDSTSLLPGQKPAIHYYDSAASKWVELGGTVSGNKIEVSVDHFTRFAVLVKEAQVLAPLTPVQKFSDLSEQHWAKPAIDTLIEKGAISGYSDGSFKPENHITRAEFVSILNKALQLPDYNPLTPGFSDVSTQDWFYGSVENAVHAGIIAGYGQRFNPEQEISREELAVILVNALGKSDEARASMNDKTGFVDDATISSWSRGFVVKAVDNNLLKGYLDNSFNPQGKATRAEACVTILNLLNMV